ncbi:unnamed protein product [Symbiodinium necroappetens]|uniref:Uncharacterized protein n=1 Tax=Symbiodinium necroappetens TaxID=1628268 RepID=A0A813C5K7_9DINO|nr:unnamed protein product [Symbiodinium necroappetens]
MSSKPQKSLSGLAESTICLPEHVETTSHLADESNGSNSDTVTETWGQPHPCAMKDGVWPAKPRGQKSPFSAWKQPGFWAVWGPQYAVFLFLLFLYTFGFMALPSICVILSASFLMVAGVLFAFKHEVRTFLPASLMLPVATAAGSIGGLYTYDVYAIYPQFYSNARVYADVLPSQPSAAVADAGKLVFSSSAFVDIQHSVSYITERGSVFCVAPVRDSSQVQQMQYWAVGTGCCSLEGGDFWCDAAKDRKATGGIVIFDNEGFFSSSSYDEYRKASRKAEATYQLMSVSEPRYVRWVMDDNLNALANEYNIKTALALCGMAVAYGAISYGLVVLTGKLP